MWGSVKDRKSFLEKAIEFTGDAELYGDWMLRVIEEWPNSCEHNLTDISQNRGAWIGHAAVALAIQGPEDIVRSAWAKLWKLQQARANAKADEAIRRWECQREYLEKQSMRLL